VARPEPEILVLRIGGVNWGGWKSVEIARQMDAISSEFKLGLADRWQHGAEALPLAVGMPCEVLIGGEAVIDGYLDKAEFSTDLASHVVNVSGRDKSADLVDCAAIHSPGSWRDLDALELARELAEPFGVEARKDTGVDVGEKFGTFKLEEGETAFDALDRALRQRGLLAMPGGRGGILLARLAGERSSTALVQGVNVKESSSSFDMSERFSDYIVKGQRAGTDNDYGEGCAAVRGEARDPGVARYRPFMVRAEGQVTAADAIRRARWEASTRAARSVTVTATVAGWRQDDGSLWKINMLVPCRLPYLRIEQDLLISRLTFSLTQDGGTVSRLELKDPKAFEPEPPKKKDGGSGGGAGRKGGELQQESADSAWGAHKEMTGD
jgi:prophage tail gpP-like protein